MIDHWIWGMHAGVWIVGIVVIAIIIVLLTRSSEPRNSGAESPLEILQRRYAAGEISTEEYNERKAQLENTLP